MIAVVFELTPADGHRQEYLDIVAQLRPLLDGTPLGRLDDARIDSALERAR